MTLVFLFQFHHIFISINSLSYLMLVVSLNVTIINKGAMEKRTNNLIPFKHPKYYEYNSFTARRDSYFHYEWPIGLRQTPDSLAEAGLFYFGESDRVRCYHCGGGLSKWQQEDNPWKEHARSFPTCVHVRMQKTQEFINHAQIIYITTNANNLSFDNYDTTSKRTETGTSLEKNIPNGIRMIGKLFHKEVAKEKNKEEDHKHETMETLQDIKCKICIDNDINVAFLNCGHIYACSTCALGCEDCPVCRAKINKFVKIYFS